MDFYQKKLKPVITVVALLVAAVMIFNSMKGYTYTIDSTKVTITKGKGIDIALTDIKDVQYYDRLPALSNRVGESIGNKRSGTFTVEGVGRGKVYATDITKPGIIIFAKDTFYAITPDNAEQFMNQIKTQIGK